MANGSVETELSALGARHSSGAVIVGACKDAPLEWRAPS